MKPFLSILVGLGLLFSVTPDVLAQNPFFQGPGTPDASYSKIEGEVISLRTWNGEQHCGLVLTANAGGRLIVCADNEDKMGPNKLFKTIKVNKVRQIGTQRVRVGPRWRTVPVVKVVK